jgi:aspartyl-tRNA(Asn)/glutamyl-tRNA(Gln) amidotransferase subunit A
MPTSATSAPLLGQYDSHGGHPSLTRPWNVTGSPALSICSGFARDGMPVAVQIIGRRFEDEIVLRAGHALERALGTRDTRPSLDLPAATAGPTPADAAHRSTGHGAGDLAEDHLAHDIEAAIDLIASRSGWSDPWTW